MPNDTRAWLPVAKELEDTILLPPGFRDVWSVDLTFSQMPGIVVGSQLLIEGPFPDGVEDCGRVAAQLSLVEGQVHWQWCHPDTLKPLSDPVPVNV